MKFDIQEATLLSKWFIKNGRKLPWRNTHDAYDVWLSEIMLQQTRIEAVIPKYLAFKETLPTIQDLANCNEEQLLRLWEGLGYYNRARNLKKCASILVEKYDCHLPKTKKELLSLPGIGEYTSGAILSIAYGIGEPAIDGNVLRVFARYTLDNRNVLEKPIQVDVYQMIASIFQQNDSKQFIQAFTQGIMELGEVVCLPNGQPKCNLCPLQYSCLAHKDHQEITYPTRIKKNEKKVIYKTICIIHTEEKFLFHKREDKGLLANLYEFYNEDKHYSKEEIEDRLKKVGWKVKSITPLPPTKHIFTHLIWDMIGYDIQVSSTTSPLGKEYQFYSREEIKSLALPSAFSKYVRLFKLR